MNHTMLRRIGMLAISFLAGFFGVGLAQVEGQQGTSAQVTGFAKSESGQEAWLESRVMDRIPPGTSVFDEKSRGFSNVLLFVKGRLAAGDIKAVSSTVKYYGDLFNLVYLADVVKKDQEYVLEKVAVGFSSRIKDRDIVVTSGTAKNYGLQLSLIGRGVLSGNEEALKDIRVVARNQRTAVIDAPSVIYYQEKHQEMITRFYVWVSPEGRVGTVAWLLRPSRSEYSFAEDHVNYLPPGMVEDRVLHVDGSKFSFGIPAPDAFAMVSIPKGRSYSLTPALQQIGASPRFTDRTLDELAKALAEALQQK